MVKLALQAAALLGIDVAEVDYITPDITASPKTTKGAICELNVTPGLVNDGNEDDLIGALLNPFFPAGDDGRIEVICCVKEQDFQPQFIEALASLLDADATRVTKFISGMKVRRRPSHNALLQCWQIHLLRPRSSHALPMRSRLRGLVLINVA